MSGRIKLEPVDETAPTTARRRSTWTSRLGGGPTVTAADWHDAVARTAAIGKGAQAADL